MDHRTRLLKAAYEIDRLTENDKDALGQRQLLSDLVAAMIVGVSIQCPDVDLESIVESYERSIREAVAYQIREILAKNKPRPSGYPVVDGG